jgi:hypothetical protein
VAFTASVVGMPLLWLATRGSGPERAAPAVGLAR